MSFRDKLVQCMADAYNCDKIVELRDIHGNTEITLDGVYKVVSTADVSFRMDSKVAFAFDRDASVLWIYPHGYKNDKETLATIDMANVDSVTIIDDGSEYEYRIPRYDD